MAKFTEIVTNLNDKIMIAGLILIFQPFVSVVANLISPSGLITSSNIGYFISYIIVAIASMVAGMLALFVAIYWGFNKHRPMFEIAAILFLLFNTAIVSTVEIFMIGNVEAEKIYTFTLGLLPYVFLLLDVITKKQPRLFAVFFIIGIATQIVSLIPVASGAFVESQGMINTLVLIGEFRTLANLPLYGMYLLSVTERGKVWLDKMHAAILFLAYGACDLVLVAIEIALYASIYGGIFRMPFFTLSIIRDGFAVFVGLRAWLLCKKSLPDNVLYHVL